MLPAVRTKEDVASILDHIMRWKSLRKRLLVLEHAKRAVGTMGARGAITPEERRELQGQIMRQLAKFKRQWIQQGNEYPIKRPSRLDEAVPVLATEQRANASTGV